jgi:drug/metabolite transporter (DMT)-like permease
MLIAGLFEGGYFYTLSKTLQLAPLGLGYAVMRGGAMVFVWVFSATFLREKVSALSVFGILLILFGIALANPHKSEKGFSKNGFLFAILAAFFIAGYHIFYGFSLQHGASQVTLFVGSMLVSIPVLIIICGKSIFQIKSHLAGHKKYMILLAGVLSAASFILFLYGLKSTEAGLAISLRNTSVAFAQLFALILGERLNRTQWFAFSCVLCGTVFLI